MLRALSIIIQLAAGDISRQKRRIQTAAISYAIAMVAALFAVGFGATALAIWLSELYDAIIATIIVSAVFLIICCLTLLINAMVQRRIRRKRAQSSALKGAAVATGLTALRRQGPAPLLIALIGLAAASQVLGRDKQT